MKRPPITVLITVRNGSRYLRPAIESVRRQTYSEIQIVVVDDASEDETSDILDSIHDSRLEVIRSSTPLGIADAKAVGLRRAQGDYVAMMDADDIAVPTRVALQKEYLDGRPDLDVVGSNVIVIGADSRPTGIRMLPACHLAVLWRLLIAPPFIHPTVMLRRRSLGDLPYRREFRYSQDYDLWSRMLRAGRGSNLRQPLVLYRSHPGQHTRENRIAQLLEHDQIVASVIAERVPNFDVSSDVISRMWRFMTGATIRDPAIDEISSAFVCMARSFLGDHEGCEGRGEVLQDVAVTLARRLHRQLGTRAARSVLSDLYRLDPHAPVRSASRFLSYADLRLRSRPTARRLVGAFPG